MIEAAPPARTATCLFDRSICIGTITRGRPEMLKRLLQSYAEMDVPTGVRLHFVVVENSDVPTLRHIIETFSRQVPQWRVQYELEPRLGIAVARNRVLGIALTSGNHLLTFADDDEIVAPDWLAQLLAEHDTYGLDLVGSPVRRAPLEGHRSLWQKIVWNGLDQLNRHAEAKANGRRQKGRGDAVLISTGSWMGDLAFFRRTNLRFDEALAFCGGEDGGLWAEAKRLGAKSGWCPSAIVYETVCPERLSLSYTYRRSRDGTISTLRTRLKANPKRVAWRVPGSVVGRLLSLMTSVILIPISPGRSLVRAAWYLGSIAGILQALMGRQSAHYLQVVGA